MARRAPSRAAPAPEAELADEAWAALAAFFWRHGGRHMAEAVRVSGLNPGAVKALQSLDPHQPQPMSTLATAWGCDASNVTWLVDRLEERTLVERRTSPTDRRVKTVVVTAAGVEMRERVAQVWSKAPEEFRSVPPADLAEVLRIFSKLAEA